MELFAVVKQVIIQLTICFSFLNYLLTISINSEKSYPKLLGMSFCVPCVLGLYCAFFPDILLQKMVFNYIDLIFLGAILLISIAWRWKKYMLTLTMIHFYCLIMVFLMPVITTVPGIFILPAFQGGFSLSLTALIIYTRLKEKKDKEASLLWGIAILGIIQTMQLIVPEEYLSFIAAGKAVAYSVLFYYLVQKAREPYLNRIKKAESKLANMSKTISHEVKRKTFEIERHNEHLRNMVHKDPILDIYNKKGILNELQRMIEGHDPFTILFFDIDNFKGINDTQGHLAGDMVLRKVASIAKNSIRGFDLIGRYGGDEFLIILPKTTILDAMYVSERFRNNIKSQTDSSVSIGVAVFPDDGKTVQEIIKIADAGIYEAKKQGKNAVAHAAKSING